MSGRINKSIRDINERLKNVSVEQQDKLNKNLKMTWSELASCQTLQSYGFASGLLTLEEAQELYRIYGSENPTDEKWDKLPLAEKVVGIQICTELSKKRANIL